MEEKNYIFEKKYTIPYETFKEGYTEFQKKFVYPKNYIFMAAFILVAIVFVAAVIEDKSQYIAYILIVICAAMAARQWYNPRKLRSELFDAVKSMGEPVYKIGVAENYIDISTVSFPEPEENEEEESSESAEAPEPTRIPLDASYNLVEHEKFFLMFSGKELFYIIPKEKFNGSELEIIRKTGKTSGK